MAASHKRIVIQVIEDDGRQLHVVAEGHWPSESYLSVPDLEWMAKRLAKGEMCAYDCDSCRGPEDDEEE